MSTLNCQLKLDIQPRFAFDLRHEVPHNIRFLSQSTVVYPVGRHLAVHQLQSSDAFLGGQHSAQAMGFLIRRLGHAPDYEEGTQNTASSVNPAATIPGTDGFEEKHISSSPSPANPSSNSANDLSHLARHHWNSQSLIRLKPHERDWLSRHESQLLSSFAVHHQRKSIAYAEYSTELRLVTVSVADIHQANEEEFTDLQLRRVRMNFVVLPCVAQLVSDRGRREARDRRDRHNRRKALLRKVEVWKAAKRDLEEKRIEQLKRQSEKENEEKDTEILATTGEIYELRRQIEEAEKRMAEDKTVDEAQEADSDYEGYASDELRTDDEEDDDDTDSNALQEMSRQLDADSRAHHHQPSSHAPPASAFSFESPRQEKKPQVSLTKEPAAPLEGHRAPTENWLHRTEGVVPVYDTTEGVKYAEDYSVEDMAAGPMPPAIPDHSKEELLFSRIVCMEFSRDGKYVAMAGDGPKFPLMVWDITQKEMMGAHRFLNQPVHRIDIRPCNGPLTVITLSKDCLRKWEIKAKFQGHFHPSTVLLQVPNANKEQLLDFTFLPQFRNSMALLTTSQIHLFHDEQLISSLPFSSSSSSSAAPSTSSIPSLPRSICATEKGFAVAFEMGLVHSYEFHSRNTLFVGPPEFVDSDASAYRKYNHTQKLLLDEEELLENNAREEQLKKEKKLEAGFFQSSLFERFHHLTPHNLSSPTSNKKKNHHGSTPFGGMGDLNSPSARKEKESVEAAKMMELKQQYEVFLSKAIPVFRPVPGYSRPTAAQIPSILANASAVQAASSNTLPVAKPPPLTPRTASTRGSISVPSPKSTNYKAANITVDENAGNELMKIQSMVCDPDRNTLLITSKTREIVSIKLKDVSVCTVGDEAACVQTVTSGLHHGPVAGMSMCAEQPLMVSCSMADNSVRVHNYLDRQCEIMKVFDCPPLCVSIHPQGHEIAVGFHVNMFTFRVFPNELLLRGEMSISNVSHCAYSHGGQYLAAVSGKNVMVYASNTCKTAAKFVGHVDAVMALYWNADDTSLFSVGLGGHMYEWSMHTHTRLREFVSYDACFTDICISADGNIAIAAVSSHTDNTFVMYTHTPPDPYQYNGAFQYTHYMPPTVESQHALGVGIGVNSQTKSMGLYTTPKNKISLLSDEQFEKAYVYARRGRAIRILPSGKPEEFCCSDFKAKDALPVFSSYSRWLLAREYKLSQQAAAAAIASSKLNSQHSSAAAALAAAASIKASRLEMGTDPMLDAFRSEAFPHTTPSPLKGLRPPHCRVAWIQMGRVWFLLAGTHRGSIEIWRTPLEQFPEPMFEVALHTEPITSLQVCQKLGVILTASMDGSIFVSSLSVIPFTYLTDPPLWSDTLSMYSCLVPAFFRYHLYPAMVSSDFNDLYADQKNSIQEEHAIHERYRRNQVEKRLYGSYRNAENEDLLVSRAAVHVRKQYFVDLEKQLYASRHQKAEFTSEWEFKLLKDELHLKSVLDSVEVTYRNSLAIHQDEKHRLQVKDIEREKNKYKQLDQVEEAHATAVTMLERLYERKLTLEVEKNEKARREFQDTNMKLSNDLAATKKKFMKEISEIRSLYEKEKDAHYTNKTDLTSRLKTIEDEITVVLEEQDIEHDMDRIKGKKEIANQMSVLNASMQGVRDDATRLQVELDAVKLKNKSLSDQASEWRVRHGEEVDATKAVEMKLKAEKIEKQKLELDINTKDTQIKTLEANVSRLEGQRLDLREQVAALLEKLELNDIPKAKMELESVVRELDSEFEEKALQASIMKKELHDKKARIVILSKENAALQANASESKHLLDRLREDIVRFKDIRQLRDKYAEFTTTLSDPGTFRRKIEHEFARQLQFYSHTTATLQSKLTLAEAKLEASNERRIMEGIQVMRQVNDLRHRNKDYKDDLLKVTSDLNARKLKDKLKFNTTAEALAERAERDPLHISRNHASARAKNKLSRIISRYVDVDNRKYSSSGVVTNRSSAEEAAAESERVRKDYEKFITDKHTALAAAAATTGTEEEHALLQQDYEAAEDQIKHLKDQVDIMRAMKEESERMLTNSYRRIEEQETEIGMLRTQNDEFHSHVDPNYKPRTHAIPAATTTITPAALGEDFPKSAEYIDSLIQSVAQKRAAEGGAPPSASPRVDRLQLASLTQPQQSSMFPRPPSTASTTRNPSSGGAPISGSQSARSAQDNSLLRSNFVSNSVSASSGNVQSRAGGKSTLQPSTARAPASSSTTLSARANAIVAQSKNRLPATARAESRVAVPQSPSIAAFDADGMFREAVKSAHAQQRAIYELPEED